MAARAGRRGPAAGLVGLTVLALFGAGLYVAFASSRGLPGLPYTIVRADFTTVGPMTVGSDVRENGVRVGQVSELAFRDGHAVATLQITGHRPVYRDARAVILSRSPLEEFYVQLDPGHPSSGPLGHHVLPLSQTSGAHTLDELLDVFDAPTRDALSATLRQLGDGAAGHSRDLNDALGSAPDLLNSLSTTSGALASPQADLPALLQNADVLASRFQGRQQQISALVANLDTTIRALAVDHGVPLRKSLQSLPATLTSARGALDSLDQPLGDTRTALATLAPGATALGSSTPNLRGFLRESVRPLRKVPSVARLARPAVNSLTTVIADARPLVPRVAEALDRAVPPLEVLAPYSPEAALAFKYAASAFGLHDAAGTYALHVSLTVNTSSVTGILPLRDPTANRDPYPAPGQAERDRATTLLGLGGSR